MENALYIVLAPWLIFVLFAAVAKLLMKSAKKRRGVAFAFGVLVQMFNPDPFIERTIKTVIVEKRCEKKQSEGERQDNLKE